MDISEILYESIFRLPQTHEEIKSLKSLSEEIQKIITLIKNLKDKGRQQDIERKCFKNQKLILVSKILKESYFRVYEIPSEIEETSTLRYIPENQLSKKESLPPLFMSNVQISVNNLANSRYMVTMAEIKLKNLLISMFYNMLVNQKMLSFMNYMNVPLYIYLSLLKSYSQYGKYCLKYKQTEKCLKFIYQYIKVTKENIPKVYIHLLKHFLQLYHKNYENEFQDSNQCKDKIKLCYSYIFETCTLILKKNLFLAAKCGILSLLYHKCIEGALTTRKVETITEIIINFCIEEKSRTIIHSTIDLGKTFAIFTNVDMVQSIHQKLSIVNKSKNELGVLKNSLKNIDGLSSCAVMIEMYLSNWTTLMYFLQQVKTLNNFIISLKRKSEEEITLLNDIIFKKIMKRCINYNRKKIIKSNNIFNIESNYLILKSLIILNFFYRHNQFKQLIYGNTFMLEFKENFIEILLEYFISNEEEYKNREINKLLINNIKNINYYRKINIDISKKRVEDQGMINNNIESYYSESLLPFEFNVDELKGILIKISKIVENEKNKMRVFELFTEINKRGGEKQLQESELLAFYKLGLEISQEIKWLDNCLDISKYLSSILLHLRCSKSIIDISERCRDYIRCIFEAPQYKYFQYLNINILDDIGRYFYSDNKVIEYLNGYISDNTQAYKISRILLHIDYERNNNQSIDGPEKVYSEICRRGSKALILQIIQIIKYSCEQNENRFLSQHLQILFTLIYNNDQDIVYSIIELLQEFVNKTKQLEDYILNIDMKRIRHWNKRVLYLLLHYENAILEIKEGNHPTFLNDELQKWESGENRKKTYYSFVLKELKKFTQDSILSTDYLNLNLDPSNYRKLIFLPWNIKINQEYYPIYIEYKNLQDKLKLKIYLNLKIVKEVIKEIVIEELYIGSHNYTKYIEAKHVFDKKQQDLKIKLTLDEIRKQHLNKGKELKSFVVTREETIFFINYENEIYKIERININIPLTLDTYRPLSHPLNYINLLCRTKLGFEYLRREKFIDHCLEIVRDDQFGNKDEYKGALVCLGTLCASFFMPTNEKLQVYDLLTKRFLSIKNHEIQQICFWIINILIKDHIIRGRIKNYLVLIETKRCGWICLPEISCLERESVKIKKRMESNITYIKENLPEKIENQAYQCLCSILNVKAKDEQYNSTRMKEIFDVNKIDAKVLENIVKYVSVIDFPPANIYQALHKLSYYIVHEKFEQDYPNAFSLP